MSITIQIQILANIILQADTYHIPKCAGLANCYVNPSDTGSNSITIYYMHVVPKKYALEYCETDMLQNFLNKQNYKYTNENK